MPENIEAHGVTAGGRLVERPLWGGVILTVESIPLFYPGSL
jgi:hypothetical protein